MTDKLSTQTQKFGVGKTLFLIVIAYFCKKTIDAGDPFYYALPNFLLFMPALRTTEFLWSTFHPRGRFPKNFKHQHIATLTKEEFSFEALQKATKNFKHPAVVRGFFDGTPAMEKWSKQGYLSSYLGDFTVPYIRTAQYDTQQDDRAEDLFRTISDQILTNSTSTYYLFFPVKSRLHFNGSDAGTFEKLVETVNTVVHDDLELDRIWKGFGTSAHKTFKGSQLIMGVGGKSLNSTTGTGWHCAPGNNWFAQVVGKKRWYFMEHKYSAYMNPLRGGTINMQIGKRLSEEEWKDLPYSYGDIYAGDLLYNPDWYWHTIQNYEGLSIGCPVREFNMSVSFRNNAQYTSIIILNKLANRFGFDIGGYAKLE